MERVVFLDRDGTINVDHGYVHRVADWEFHLGAPEALRDLQSAGYQLIVVTNQSGVGQGLYPESAVHELHQHMEAELEKAGVKLTAVLYCPHARDAGCSCRKPKPGMVEAAEKLVGGIAYRDSWMVGDKVADILCGQNHGMRTALLRSQYWQQSELPFQPHVVADSLAEAAHVIVAHSHATSLAHGKNS